MFCANCKIISIHLRNYDSFICENVHVVCARCQDQSKDVCAVCGGKIIVQGEFHVTGVRKAYFKTAEDMEKCCEVPVGEMQDQNATRKTRKDEDWQNDTDGPPSDVTSCLTKRFSECEDEIDSNWNDDETLIGDFKHVKLSVGNEIIQHFLATKPICNDSEHSLATHSKNEFEAVKSSTSIEEYPMDYHERPLEDPKLFFHKVMSGKLQFDTQKDFFERMAKVNRIQDTINRPQLEAARNRSFKIKEAANSQRNNNNELKNSLREKLKAEIYSGFEKQPVFEKNKFMTKTSETSDQVSGAGAKDIESGNFTAVINTEIEKDLNKITNMESLSATQRREEMIRLNKAQIRQEILNEIYSNFNENCQTDCDGNKKEESKNTEPSPNRSTTIYSGKKIEKLSEAESDPKLNPDLTVVEISRKAVFQPSTSKISEKISLHSQSDEDLLVQTDLKIVEEPVEESSKILSHESPALLPSLDKVCYVEPTIPNPPQEQIDDIEKNNKHEAELKESTPSTKIAKALAEHFRKELKNNIISISFMQKKFPQKTLEEIKEILINLPEAPGDYIKKDKEVEIKKHIPNEMKTLPDDSIDSPRTEVSNDFLITNNAWRAYYCPPSDLGAEPMAQFKPINPIVYNIACTVFNKKQGPSPAELNLPRNPLVCPISSCKRHTFVSGFSKHIKIDHSKILIESISPGGKCRNLFLDPKVVQYGVNKCQILYLVTNKIRDLGINEFKDFLPVLVMSTKVRISDFLTPQRNIKCKDFITNQPVYLMIWLTGLCAPNLQTHFSITLWARSGAAPRCHVVHSGELYSIRNSQNPRELYESGQVLLLSNEQCNLLTNGGQDMIEMQVIVN